MKRLYAIIAVAALFSSCVKEVVEPGMRISGTYTSDDGSGLNEQYISFEDGDFSQVSFSKALSYMEDSFWGYNKSYEKVKKNPYSIQEGNLIVAGKPMGPIELKENFLLFQGKRYSKVKGFNEELYSSITLPEGTTKTITYETKEYSLPVTINRPIPAGNVIASSSTSWISEVKVQDGGLTFKASETKVDRDGTILLRYTNADNVTLSIAQRPSTFIKLAENERTISYAQASHSLSYSIENPIPGSAFEVSCTANWVKNIVIGTDAITFDVDENPGNSSRVARFTCSYSGAANVSFTLTQSGAVTTIVTTPTSQSCIYVGGDFSFDFTIENPRQGVDFTAISQSAWITDVSISGNTISYKVAENNSGNARNGKIKLTYGNFATKEFSVSQSWSASEITVTPASQEVTYTGGSFSLNFSVSNPREGVSVTASSQSDWITGITIAGNTVNYKVAENNSGSSRTGKIKLSYGPLTTKEFSVSQSWSASEITTTPASQEITYSGGSFSLDFSVSNPREGVTMTASSQSEWITSISVSGNKISYKVVENNSGSARNGKIKLTYGNFAEKEFSVSQAWAASEITTSPESQEVSYTGGNFSLDYSVSNPREGATVTASSQSDWITNISVSNNKINYKIAENNSAAQRSGSIKLSYGIYATKSFSVTQTGKPVQSITLNKSNLELYAGNSESLTATVDPSDAELSWSSSNTSIAKVSTSGVVTGVSRGTATITVASTDGSGKSASCQVEVKQYVTDITLNYTSLWLEQGQAETLSATITPANANDKTLTWSSSNTSVATVDQTGKVTTVSAGTATITATAKDGSGVYASCSLKVLRPCPSGAVDLGLSVYWATSNLSESGLCAKPEDYGDYYAWGETSPYYESGYAQSGSPVWKSQKTGYNWASYKWCNGSYTSLTKYSKVDNKTVLEADDDVAHVKLGGSWRMPTDAEWTELINTSNCTWTRTTQNGINGYKVTSKKNGASIFLPAAGSRDGTNLDGVGPNGYYWSSSLDTGRPRDAHSVFFYSDYVSRSYDSRYYGQSVRPVSE